MYFIKIFLKICSAFCLGIIVFMGIVFWKTQNKLPEKKDCFVVFGAAVWQGQKLSSVLKDRMNTALYIAKKQKSNCFIFSGGKTKFGPSEAVIMKKYAEANGVEKSAITVDDYGHNTYQTIKNLDPLKSYILVSSDFHIPRITLLASKKNLHFETLSSYTPLTFQKAVYYWAREFIANLYYFFWL